MRKIFHELSGEIFFANSIDFDGPLVGKLMEEESVVPMKLWMEFWVRAILNFWRRWFFVKKNFLDWKVQHLVIRFGEEIKKQMRKMKVVVETESGWGWTVSFQLSDGSES